MLQLVNLTDLACARTVLTDATAQHVLVVGIKATFDLPPHGDPLLAAEQEAITLFPRHIGDDTSRTLLRDTDMTLDHGGTDVIVNAQAHAPGGQAVRRMRAEVTVGTLHSTAMVTGDRSWIREGRQIVPGPTTPFLRMPIVYERAFGGGHGTDASGTRIWDARNPIGQGYCTDPARLIGTPVPNIKATEAPLARAVPKDTPPVAGFAARPAHWEPRKTFAGTYDAAWQKSRLPLWPQDMDPRFFRCAAPDLQSSVALVGHEPVTLVNLSAHGRMAFTLPRIVPLVRTVIRGSKEFQPVHLRRVIIEPDLARMTMLWRAVVPCGADARIVERVVVDQRRIVRAVA